MENWVTFSSQKLSIALKYPNPTPQGHPVFKHERTATSSYRVHFVSDGSDEVYFEIGRYSNLPVQKAIDDFQQDVMERIDQIETSEVTELSMDNYPSYQFSIRWPGKERFIQFIEIEPVLYRIIHDPASPINKQILESLEFR
jgi:hypothetical protein